MIKIIITTNQGNQRLDRFLKKYFAKAPLSRIYRMIRKDVKLNGKRAHEDTLLQEGDELTLYITEEEAESMKQAPRAVKAKRQFQIAYEDDDLLIVSKPYGLLTHGDSHEKKNHLANQVIDYLIAKGDYDPLRDRPFTPAPANRIDRNTTGLVIFAKNSQSLREINALLRTKSGVSKYYLTIVNGRLPERLVLKDLMVKDERANRARIVAFDADPDEASSDSKYMETIATPLAYGKLGKKDYTLVEAQILTGRTHQIRVQLAAAGYPLYGDFKYGTRAPGRATQLLHSYKLAFGDLSDTSLSHMSGKVVTQMPPEDFKQIADKIFPEWMSLLDRG